MYENVFSKKEPEKIRILTKIFLQQIDKVIINVIKKSDVEGIRIRYVDDG